MLIYGVSQTSGVERKVKFDRAGAGVLLTIVDLAGDVERERIIVVTDDIMANLMTPQPGGSAIEGEAPESGAKKQLEMEIRRNEVWLRSHAGAEEGCDVAVGLDDFQDALESVVSAG